MNIFDVALWAMLMLLVARQLNGAGARRWLLFGIVAGLGLLNKLSVLLLGVSILVGIVLGRRFDVLRSPWFWLGGVFAAAIFGPHLAWQYVHDWPTLEFVARLSKAFSRVSFWTRTRCIHGCRLR